MSELKKECIITMDQYKIGGSKIYSGRPEGREVRSKLDLKSLENEYEVIKIKFPDDTQSVNSSFFLGLFGASVRELKEDGFNKKYSFYFKRPIIERNIKQGIFDALNVDE